MLQELPDKPLCHYFRPLVADVDVIYFHPHYVQVALYVVAEN